MLSFLIGALMAKTLELLHELVPKVQWPSPCSFESDIFSDTNSRCETRKGKRRRRIGEQLVVVNMPGQARASWRQPSQKARSATRRRGYCPRPTRSSMPTAARLAALAAHHAIPAMYPIREFVMAGGLMSYGSQHHRCACARPASTRDRILKGEKPAKFAGPYSRRVSSWVINLKTAKALGLECS